MKALDLCCGAGGVSRGLVEAGFEVTGVDIAPQPHYPYRFIQADALEFLATQDVSDYALKWASWPCQAFTSIRHINQQRQYPDYPDLITPGRELLQAAGGFYIIENVIGAPVENATLLCGTMFGLGVLRHRLFESNLLLLAPPHPRHEGRVTPPGKLGQPGDRYMTITGNFADQPRARRAMGIDWPMTRKEIAQAIPPAYSHYLGVQVLRALRQGAAA